MPVILPLRAKRTTRAALNAQKAASGLLQGEPYLITDESRLAVGTAANNYADMATKAEVDACAPLNGTGTSGIWPITARDGIFFIDSRSVTSLPGSLQSKSLTAEFKNLTAVDAPPIQASGMYAHILNIVGWHGSEGSGGYPSQLSIGAGGIAVRQGTSSTTWGPWIALTTISPALTGTPTAPTAAAGTSTTQLATTAFVQQATAPAPVVVTANATVVLTGLRAVYACNTQAGSFTLTLPANPAAGTTVKVVDYKSTFAVNNLTVARNGENILGLAEGYILDVSNHGREFVYIDATMGWNVQ